MSNLLSVAEFSKVSEKFNSPQKVNYAIRKQNAPTDTSTGKRMIDPEAWKAWEDNADIVTRKSKSEGLSAGGNATRIQKKHGVSKGDLLAWKSGMNNEKISGGKVASINDHYAGTLIDDAGMNSPLSWEGINDHIKKGNMMVVNHPEQLLYVLAQHYKGEGENDTYEQLKALYARHKTEEAKI